MIIPEKKMITSTNILLFKWWVTNPNIFFKVHQVLRIWVNSFICFLVRLFLPNFNISRNKLKGQAYNQLISGVLHPQNLLEILKYYVKNCLGKFGFLFFKVRKICVRSDTILALHLIKNVLDSFIQHVAQCRI